MKTMNEAGLYNHSDFPIGVAADMGKLVEGSVYKKTVTDQFNSVTPENNFKASALHPEFGRFEWKDADALAGYCGFYGKRLHGHTLIWHLELPGWIESFQGSHDEWDLLFKNHIQSIVGYFKGRVAAWDVLNEAFDDQGAMRESVWKKHLGESYIEKALRYASEADQDALLFYNDYLLEDPLKRKHVMDFLNNLRNKGVKIDGIGIQAHIDVFQPNVAGIIEAVNDVAGNNYRVHLSEVDISINPTGNEEPDKSLLNLQAQILCDIVTGYKKIPAFMQYGITFWGVGDMDSWVTEHFGRKDHPLLFDEHYNPKPAYWKLKEIL